MPLRAHHAALLISMLVTAACTTMTVEERISACQATEWSSYGENDGRLGVAEADRTEKFSECAALGYPADLAAYDAGRAEGLKSYCTVDNGYEAGYAGRRYRNVCPPELEPSFQQGYEQGQKERPVNFYPYFGFGYGYSHFGFFGGHRHRHRRY
ncbi:MAG TPA: DUF2799 domain-containing protein [Thermohalobaculum sp.]|nr:DUF2799 domain-containing protein [Thermohalobaculum sp.]